MQEDNSITKRLFCVVDYHAITQKYVGLDTENFDGGLPDDPNELRDTVNKDGTPQELSLKTAATLIACGIDPLKSTLFV